MKNFLTYRPDNVGIFFLCVLTLASVSFSRAQDIRLTPNVQDTLSAKPGSIVTVTATVANQSPRKQTYDARLILPAGWRVVMGQSQFDLQPKANDIRLLSFAVPADARAGEYEVRYTVADRATPRQESETILRVLVQPVRELQLHLVGQPRFILAGREYKATFLVMNNGNASATALISARSTLDFSIRLDATRVELAPRESKSFAVSVATQPDLITKTLHHVEVTAQLVDDAGVSVVTSSSVEIIPNVTVAEDRYHELPVYISLRGMGMESNSKLQIQAGGTGSFSETGDDRIDFLFRGPGTQHISILGQQDEYRISYKRRGLELFLGDGSYSLSPLTELGRYGTGAGAKISTGDVTFRGYYNETRWYSPAQKQFGGGVSYSPAEQTEIGVQYLKKQEAAAGGVDGDIATVRGLFENWQTARLDVEYALGKAQGNRGDAYAVRVNGSEKWMQYDVRYVHADPQYPGYYKDINFASASFNVSLWGGARLEAYARTEERNLRRDSTLFYAPQDQYFQIGMGYSSFVSFYYRRNQQKDIMPVSQYQRVEDVAQVQLGYTLLGVDLHANADFGRTHDQLQNKQVPSKRYALFSTIRPTTSQSYNTSLEYAEDQNLFTGETQKRYSAGLNAWLSFGESTQAQASGYTSRVTGSFEQTYSSVEFMLEHKFPFNHKITLRGRQNVFSPTFGTRERAYALEYLIPMNIPVKRLTTSGSLRGRVVGADGRGLENVLVNVGAEAAMTDRNGNFFFAALQPERHFLIIDKATIGLDRIAIQPMPMEVVVRGGAEENVGIHIVRSASLSGVVRLYHFAEENPLDSTKQQIVDAGTQRGIVVELSNGGESHRRISDNRGAFSFTDMRPGQWTMKVIGGEIPQYHAVEMPSYDITLEPGEQEQAIIRILPRRRTIQILQQGGVLQQQGRTPVAVVTPALTSPSPLTPPTVKQGEPCLIHFRKEKGGYLLQVSSWTNEEKANEQARIAEIFSGVPAFVESVTVSGRGIWHRVYIGPVQTRAEADALCRKIQSQK